VVALNHALPGASGCATVPPVTDAGFSVSDSRGRRGASYHLITPPNRYPSRLAELQDTSVIKLATPRTQTARFGQYLLELAPGGGSRTPVGAGFEHFLLGLGGEALLDGEPLGAGAFAFVPQGSSFTLTNSAVGPALVMWLKRRYVPAEGWSAPAALRGHRDDHAAVETPVGLLRRELLPPDDPAFDFNMSLLAFPPGVSLGQVEVHDEEHGLYMTAGSGIYHLDGADHEVAAGDFIYMAPYCPQSFAPTGTETAEYLLYKDVFRDGF
jgi:(S)-ureidoglycine aminohydrolase